MEKHRSMNEEEEKHGCYDSSNWYGDEPTSYYDAGCEVEDYGRERKRSRSFERSDRKRSHHRKRSTRDRSHDSSRSRHRKSHSISKSSSRSPSASRSSKRHKRKKEKKKRRRSRTPSSSERSRRSRSPSHSSYSRSSRRRRKYYRSSESSDYLSDSGGSNDDRSRERDSYKYQEPNSTIMARGMASHLTERDLREDILKSGLMVKDIRLIRNRDTGTSRGFAFIEFKTVHDARKYMELKEGSLTLQDIYHVSLIYSVPKMNADRSSKLTADWYCSSCQAHNFKRRETCYRCNKFRPQSREMSGCNPVSELCDTPTCTIMLCDLDILTVEESILQAFQAHPALARIPIRSVKIAREEGTNLSKGACYVEANNIQDALLIHSALMSRNIEVDGKNPSIGYRKTAGQMSKGKSVAATALAAAQWTNSQANPGEDDSEKNIESMAKYSASLYAKTNEEYQQYLEYYRKFYRDQNPKQRAESRKLERKNDGTTEEMCPSSLKSSGASSSTANCSRSQNQEKRDSDHLPKDGEIDVSRYRYDEKSGYYYDPASRLFYDPKSQYFYNAESKAFLYWDVASQSYVPVATPSTSTSTNDPAPSTSKREPSPVDKNNKVKVAKKITKEMEKWAKTLNQKKDLTRNQNRYNPDDNSSNPGRDSLGDVTLPRSDNKKFTGPNNSEMLSVQFDIDNLSDDEEEGGCNGSGQGEKYEGTFDNDQKEIEAALNKVFADYEKTACLLCKRQFANAEALNKHLKLSDLHKKNLAPHMSSYDMAKLPAQREMMSQSSSYRDRAKERRMRYGYEPETRNDLKDVYLDSLQKQPTTASYSASASLPISDTNLGSRMLQKMGWQEGQGLGRNNSGRTDIIRNERRAEKAGLGMNPLMIPGETGDRYVKARQVTLARYQELND